MMIFFGCSQVTEIYPDHLKSFAIDHMPVLRGKSLQVFQAKQSVVHNFFSPSHLPVSSTMKVVTDPHSLAAVARDTLAYLEDGEVGAHRLINPPMFGRHVLSFNKVKQTLQFIIDLVAQDEVSGKYRLLDPHFLAQNFAAIKWFGDKSSAHQHGKKQVQDGKILLTYYTAYCCKGSDRQTKKHPYALYQVVGKQQGLPFTKQEVLRGILSYPKHAKRVKPLVWLSRNDLETILMQGVGFVTLPDGSVRLFNVHLNNNIPYDKTIKNAYDQKRYWYFKETVGKEVERQRALYEQRKDIIFAGDIYNIGAGKLVLIPYQNILTKKRECRLGIIADTGAAFHNNLYQLDVFVGMVSSYKQLYQQVSYMTETVDAYIIYKKDTHG